MKTSEIIVFPNKTVNITTGLNTIDICCYLLIILPLLLLIADSTVNNIFTDVYAEGFDNYFVYLRFTVGTQNC